MTDQQGPECKWFDCHADAVIRVPASGDSFCEDHYLLNVLRFGCDLKGELLKALGDDSHN